MCRAGSGDPLSGSIDPNALQPSTIQKRSDGADTWPIEWAGYQVLFAAVGHDVAESGDLCFCLVTDHDVLISTMPEGTTPSMQPSRLLGQVSLKVTDEIGQLLRAIDCEQKMVVVR